MFFSRTFDSSFRSLLDEQIKSLGRLRSAAPKQAQLQVRCQCGSCVFQATARSSNGGCPRAVRCHCARCRKYHMSAFAAFTPVHRRDIPEVGKHVCPMRVYRDSCDALGAVERVFCGSCTSVLATLPLEGAHASEALLALGCVEDESIPLELAQHWQEEYEERTPSARVSWWSAVPAGFRQEPQTRTLRGSCSCGGCKFTAVSGQEFQTQHCYCNLCRRLSGSVAQTWVPVRKEGFEWTSDRTLKLVRTTHHGQRHMCTECGGTMTIVYDSQPDATWPVAGALDDDSLPEDMPGSLARAIHICCSMMQPWYRLPLDGIPRLMYAG
eukprot:gnl/TRDRNA2_/TRDRNA2_74037_c0_seq2.p1 gnl/TRDRNA2_/TRDRNA2_74037_c0~~gnl/TRDRNA2_/TRDRNA2_74037_c0_seq2.p1  ORF type:complete len:325 (-),score=20.95 gnl/TRDRNA2_/TRDRNA2_74037_c0_seq2:43-1017(-)